MYIWYNIIYQPNCGWMNGKKRGSAKKLLKKFGSILFLWKQSNACINYIHTNSIWSHRIRNGKNNKREKEWKKIRTMQWGEKHSLAMVLQSGNTFKNKNEEKWKDAYNKNKSKIKAFRRMKKFRLFKVHIYTGKCFSLIYIDRILCMNGWAQSAMFQIIIGVFHGFRRKISHRSNIYSTFCVEKRKSPLLCERWEGGSIQFRTFFTIFFL